MSAAYEQTGPVPDRIRALSSAQKVVQLSGTPDAILGVAHLYRHTVDKARFVLHSMDPFETEAGHLQALHRAEILSTNLEPRCLASPFVALGRLPVEGSQATVPLRLKLAPFTPPGTYQARLRIDGEDVLAEIEVLPTRQLRILTPYVAVSGSPGETVTARLVVENAGNITEQLSTLGRVVLQEDQQVCLSLQEAISAVRRAEGDSTAGFLKFADGFVAGLAARQTSAVKVAVRDGPVLLAPGEVAALTLSLRLPRDLRAGRSYESVLITHGASIPVMIQGLAAAVKEDGTNGDVAATAAPDDDEGEP